jgi:hypothetical protein
MRARLACALLGSAITLGGSAWAQSPAAQQSATPPAVVTDPAAVTPETATLPPSYLPDDRRLPASVVDAFLAAPQPVLELLSPGRERQGRISVLASSDLRTVKALVEYARTAPVDTVMDIGAGLQRAAREADRAGRPAYGLAIQEIVAENDVASLNRAYAMAERGAGDVPQTAALGGAGGGATGGQSSGTVSGSNFGAAGGTGGANGDSTVETRLGSYPVYSSSISAYRTSDGGGGTSQLLILGGTGGGIPASPAD